MENETALARNILLALILVVIIIVVVIVVVFLVFPPVPDTMPSFRANAERSGTTVYLYHDGGDPLQERATRILINGIEVPIRSVTFLHGQDWPWTTGETIRMEHIGGGDPETVEVQYVSRDTVATIYSTNLAPLTVPVTPAPEEPPAPATPITTVPTTATPTVTLPAAPDTALPGEPVPRPPVATFQADRRLGEVPLTVRFTDLSTGSPSSWLWNFGDGGTSVERETMHTYSTPGEYTVTLTVTNPYGSNSRTEPAFITAGLLPSAQFTSTPREGPSPLRVQFSDLSTGSPDSWLWNFGDGTGSMEKNPAHLYLEPGEYSVSLTATNSHGSNTRIQTSFIRVVTTERNEVFLSRSQYGSLLPDPYLEFVVTGPGAWIRIAGSDYQFGEGDLVQLFPGDVSIGTVDVNEAGITAFSFSGVRMFVNGDLVRNGIVSRISVPEFAALKSTLTIIVPPRDTASVLFVDGEKKATSGPGSITISNLGPGPDGKMYLSKKIQDLTFRGGAESFRAG
ncbi:MAG TPA: PKD domain-containing protein [Methanoregulaceae archaeon]|nr:MAG: PKD domain-containing protein [Methanolinea sp.]HON81942.1 PKD domain-containing protein [Methanoregulaceae archaeon]HPD10660.1 PKD domain-containing protein [Methanoregulaceae archaeon]HRT15789.1 PKD domain-containing protein [Methanoregulaceae archaeon]HRU31303.1 PKD domain-containing protein [Methanoregulaceae archaeon]